VSGIEVSDEAVRFATEQLGLDVQQQTAESLSAGPATFDAAVMFDTIEHLLDPRQALAGVARALVPGGLLLVATPNFRSLSRWLLGSSWAVLSPLEHMYYFEEHTLAALLEEAGFRSLRFVRQHSAWTPQETMNFVYTHAPGSLRARLAAFASRIGGYPLARQIQRAGCQDILLCIGTRNA
jgi:2-polyprenyl-3-methyl-5-hydroxy-6-metoxy-1,4-benzoquinol methylase